MDSETLFQHYRFKRNRLIDKHWWDNVNFIHLEIEQNGLFEATAEACMGFNNCRTNYNDIQLMLTQNLPKLNWIIVMFYALTLLFSAWLHILWNILWTVLTIYYFLLFFVFLVRRTLKNGLSEEEKQHVATFIKSYWFIKLDRMQRILFNLFHVCY